ncbi:MAG: hypothetical protein LLG06_08225 [Desulfobacteraceae bacterium]|nr:hypothetical protein [Desulfobacteraceae bacterium]
MIAAVPKLRLKVEANLVKRFLALFQQGFLLNVAAGLPLEEVLFLAGFSPGYLRTRVQTVFHNGGAVDDARKEYIGSGSVIALSAALPGLAGAIFRQGSPIASLRSRVDGGGRSTLFDEERTVTVRLKLFNSVAEDMGPALLARGILLEGANLRDFFETRCELLKPAILEAELDGAVMDAEAPFKDCSIRSEQVFLVLG